MMLMLMLMLYYYCMYDVPCESYSLLSIGTTMESKKETGEQTFKFLMNDSMMTKIQIDEEGNGQRERTQQHNKTHNTTQHNTTLMEMDSPAQKIIIHRGTNERTNKQKWTFRSCARSRLVSSRGPFAIRYVSLASLTEHTGSFFVTTTRGGEAGSAKSLVSTFDKYGLFFVLIDVLIKNGYFSR
jgi:hypothetical protein